MSNDILKNRKRYNMSNDNLANMKGNRVWI